MCSVQKDVDITSGRKEVCEYKSFLLNYPISISMVGKNLRAFLKFFFIPSLTLF